MSTTHAKARRHPEERRLGNERRRQTEPRWAIFEVCRSMLDDLVASARWRPWAERFEIETELTVHALNLRMPAAEVETPYEEQPHRSFSKLKTYSNGVRILKMIFVLIKEEKPLAFLFIMFVILASVSIFWEFRLSIVVRGHRDEFKNDEQQRASLP